MKYDHLLGDDEKQFLEAWEEVYKKGILTFWILQYLSKDTYDAHGLFLLLDETDTTLNEHSLYRTLRRLYDVGVIDFAQTEGRNKFYRLSTKGARILKAFTERNIDALSNLTK